VTDDPILLDMSDYEPHNAFTLAIAVRHVRCLKKRLRFINWTAIFAWTVRPVLQVLAIYGAWRLLEAAWKAATR
jgi:hypothetical protein